MTSPALTPLDLADIWTKPPPRLEFVLPGLLRGTVGNVVAAGGTGKSFLMLATALSVATGTDIGNVWGETLGQGRVVYLSLEDPEDILRHRLHALRAHVDAAAHERARENMHVLSCAGKGINLFRHRHRDQYALSEWGHEFKTFLEDCGPKLVVIDTLNRALAGLAENDAGEMSWALAQIESIAEEAKTAIVLCHHVSKGAQTNAATGEAYAARGSSVISDNARWQVNLSVQVRRDDKGRGPANDSSPAPMIRFEIAKRNYGLPTGPRNLIRGDDGVLRLASQKTLIVEKPVAKPKLRGTKAVA